MSDELFKQIRTAAKGSGWSVKRDVLIKRAGDHVLAVHPRRGRQDILEFRAKPIAWDHLLWSILQIEANMKQPTSFHFTGAFICDTPALLQEAAKPQPPRWNWRSKCSNWRGGDCKWQTPGRDTICFKP